MAILHSYMVHYNIRGLFLNEYVDDGNAGSGAGRLVLALTSDPGPETPESSSEGPHLPHSAAFLVSILVEGEKTFASY